MSGASQASVPVQPGVLDRMGFALFVALAAHAVILLGVGFSEEKAPKINQTLEITLAQFASEEAPEQADFIAQSNQQGSGDAEQKVMPTTTQVAAFQDNTVNPVAAEQPAPQVAEQVTPPQPEPAPPEPEPVPEPEPQPQAEAPEAKQVVTAKTDKKADRVVTQKQQAEPPPATKVQTGSAPSLMAQSLEIASLEARLDLHQQQNANRPKVRRLYSASTRQSYDAAYLDSWRRKVERVGNLNYPEEAHQRGLYGSLRLLVVIRPDGSLKRVEVLKSSGHTLLDDAAKRIVHMSAPFAPFPPALRKQADLVEIIRTWRFEKALFGING